MDIVLLYIVQHFGAYHVPKWSGVLHRNKHFMKTNISPLYTVCFILQMNGWSTFILRKIKVLFYFQLGAKSRPTWSNILCRSC